MPSETHRTLPTGRSSNPRVAGICWRQHLASVACAWVFASSPVGRREGLPPAAVDQQSSFGQQPSVGQRHLVQPPPATFEVAILLRGTRPSPILRHWLQEKGWRQAAVLLSSKCPEPAL